MVVVVVARLTGGRQDFPEEIKDGDGDLAPAVIDGQRVAAAGDPGDLGDGGVVPLALERRVSEEPGHGVVVLAGQDEQRPALHVAAG